MQNNNLMQNNKLIKITIIYKIKKVYKINQFSTHWFYIVMKWTWQSLFQLNVKIKHKPMTNSGTYLEDMFWDSHSRKVP